MWKTAFSNRLMLLLLAAVLLAAIATTALASQLNKGEGSVEERLDRPYRDQQPFQTYVPHQLVVKMTPNSSSALSATEDFVSIQASLAHAPIYLISLDPAADELELADQLSQWGSVVWAHPNYVLTNLHPIQGSYPFPDQNHTGSFDDQYATLQLSLNAAHGSSVGSGVTVGIIDGGIDFANPALDGSAISGYDFVDSDNDASDLAGGFASGHGTFVAGIAHLTAPSATLRSYRVMDSDGSGNGFALARAIEQAVNDGCDVINISLALTDRHLAVGEAIDYATANGAIVIAGAGNDGENKTVYPAAEPNAMAIAAVDSSRLVADFSNFGPYVDVCAPGANIYSTYIDPDFAWWSGTSFSTAFTSGLAALLKQKFNSAYGFQIRDMIVAGAVNLDSLNPGRSGNLGAGLINPIASLAGTSLNDTALFYPSYIQLYHFICSAGPFFPNQTGLLVSTNAPATYSAEVIADSGVVFVMLNQMTGMTNDSVQIIANTNGLAPGVYFNQVMFTVDGVAQPVWVSVNLTVADCEEPPTDVVLTPSEHWFSALAGPDVVFVGNSMLSSSNAPAPYHAVIESNPATFVQLIDSGGVTNDSVRFSVHPAWLFSSGSYTNRILYYVDGISTPAILTVHLTVGDTLPQGDYAYASPESQSFLAPDGVPTVGFGAFTVYAPGTSRAFAVDYVDNPDFTVLLNNSGNTPDSVRFQIVPPASATGVYVDSLIVHVTGVNNSPFYVVNYLVVDTVGTDSSTTGPSASVNPASLSVTAGVGSAPIARQVTVSSTNAPVWFIAYTQYAPTNFVEIPDSLGMTNGTLDLVIDPSGLEDGVYRDTVVIFVYGVSNPLKLPVELALGSGQIDPVENIELWNYPNPFNPATEIGFVLPKATHVKLEVYNVLGQKIATLIDGPMQAGAQSITWNGAGIASGVYYYRLTAGELYQTRKMLLLK